MKTLTTQALLNIRIKRSISIPVMMLSVHKSNYFTSHGNTLTGVAVYVQMVLFSNLAGMDCIATDG